MHRGKHLIGAALILSGCTTTPTEFYKDPDKADSVSLCRAMLETTDSKFREDLSAELDSRGVTSTQECQKRVDVENAVLAGVAIAATVAVAAAAANNTDGGYYSGGDSYHRSYGVAWDQFYNQYYQPIWRCRDRYNGRFVDDYYCYGYARVDSTWPGWSA